MRKKEIVERLDALVSSNMELRARVAVIEHDNKKLNIRLNDAFNALECLAKEVHNREEDDLR